MLENMRRAGTPYSAPRDLQKQDRVTVIARFSCYSKKPKKNPGHYTKFCKILSIHDFLVICLR